jgi:hypothetical protein
MVNLSFWMGSNVMMVIRLIGNICLFCVIGYICLFCVIGYICRFCVIVYICLFCEIGYICRFCVIVYICLFCEIGYICRFWVYLSFWMDGFLFMSVIRVYWGILCTVVILVNSEYLSFLCNWCF